jgi:hypothetical protein
MILMIDPCNSNADLSEKTAAVVSFGVSSYVPFRSRIRNKELFPNSSFDFNIFSKYFYADALYNYHNEV